MNCLDFRRRTLAEPQFDDPQLNAHAAGCPACRAFRADVLQRDAVLADALAVPVPEGLDDRIVLAARGSRQRKRGPRNVAIAASIVVALSGALTWNAMRMATPTADMILAHVIAEPEVLRRWVEVPAAQTDAEFAAWGLALRERLGEVRYVGRCHIAGGEGLHLVVDTPVFGTATLILTPPGRGVVAGTVVRNGSKALAAPLGSGGLGIVSDERMDIEALHRWVRERLVI